MDTLPLWDEPSSAARLLSTPEEIGAVCVAAGLTPVPGLAAWEGNDGLSVSVLPFGTLRVTYWSTDRWLPLFRVPVEGATTDRLLVAAIEAGRMAISQAGLVGSDWSRGGGA